MAQSIFRTNALNTSKPISGPVFKKAFMDEIPIIREDIFTYSGMDEISLFKLSDRVKPLIDSSFILNKSELFDKEWVLASDKYVQGLSNVDKGTILGYTYQGDEYVNNYLRNPDTFVSNKKVLDILKNDLKYIFTQCSSSNSVVAKGFPFFAQLFTKNNINASNLLDAKGHITAIGNKKACEVLQSIGINANTPVATALQQLIPYIELFAADLKRIIRAGPKLTKPLKVFRGAGSDYLKEESVMKGFTSTTICLYVAEKRFAAYNNNYSNTRILYEFILEPSIPCIFLPPQNTWPGIGGRAEFEVLIDSDITANPAELKFRRIFNPPSNRCFLNKDIINKLNIDATKKQELSREYMKDFNNFSYAEMISLIEFRNIGEEFRTRLISLKSNNSGGRRRTRYNRKLRNKTHKKSRT